MLLGIALSSCTICIPVCMGMAPEVQGLSMLHVYISCMDRVLISEKPTGPVIVMGGPCGVIMHGLHGRWCGHDR